MGLLGAIGAGVGAGLESVADNMKQESAFQRQMAMLRERMTMESEQRRSDKTWEMDEGQRRLDAQNAKVNARASEIAGGRLAGHQSDLDSVASQYEQLRQKGEVAGGMSQSQYDAAMKGIEGNRGLLSSSGMGKATLEDRALANAEVTGKGYDELLRLQAAKEEREARREENAPYRELQMENVRSQIESRKVLDAKRGGGASSGTKEEVIKRFNQLTMLREDARRNGAAFPREGEYQALARMLGVKDSSREDPLSSKVSAAKAVLDDRNEHASADEKARASKFLAGSLGDDKKPTVNMQWDDETGAVYVNGYVVGTAKTAKEAKMVAERNQSGTLR